jgi:chemotaxis response regulator CheB
VKPLRVLVVDDRAHARTATARLVTRAGHTVVGEAVSGDQGVAFALARAPGLVITEGSCPAWMASS